ncbi:MAG TPA: hypothetical protein VM618_13050 [Acidimicrobiia bacterium]|nr:hypothetical protein [Acidimicrobiia bacterium]
MRRLVTPLLVALLTVAAAGCGSRVRDDGGLALASSAGESAVGGPAPSGVSATDTPASESTSPAGDGPASATASSADPGRDAAGAPTPKDSDAPATTDHFGDADGSPRDPKGIVASVEPICVEAPGTVTVTIKTAALADVAYGASFADGGHHGQWGMSMTDASGTLVWTVTVGPNAPEGNAVVAATALNSETGEGGGGEGGFRVARSGGC